MKKNILLALFLLMNIALYAQTNFKSKYLGFQYKDVEELIDFRKINTTVINLHYGVTHVKSYEDKHVLFVSKFENSLNLNDDYQLKVVDVIEIPHFNEKYYCVSLKGCFLNGKKDPTIFALARKEFEKDLTTISKVWKLDKSRGRLIDYPKSGVSCANQHGFVLND